MAASRLTFRILLRHGIWRVSLDGRFYGDYRSRSDALEAAEQAAGGRAQPPLIVFDDPDTPL
jgi:hypothetical protein